MIAIAQERLNSIDTRLSLIEVSVKNLDRGVNGNGKSGLMDRTACLENTVKDHVEDHKTMLEDKKEAEKERRDFWTKVTLLVLGMIISNVGVIVFAVLK